SVHTIDAFLAARGIAAAEATPLPRDLYIEYVEWFRRASGIEPIPGMIARLERTADGEARFLATTENGDTISAASVALAIGVHYFRNAPPALTALIPPARLAHTCDCVDPSSMRGRRCLIVGGRQSAF